MKNAAYISIGCLIVFTFLNFFVSPMSNFDLCAIYRDVDPSHLRYDITLNWKDQAIKIEDQSYYKRFHLNEYFKFTWDEMPNNPVAYDTHGEDKKFAGSFGNDIDAQVHSMKMSSGEANLLFISRILKKKPDFLIIDELERGLSVKNQLFLGFALLNHVFKGNIKQLIVSCHSQILIELWQESTLMELFDVESNKFTTWDEYYKIQAKKSLDLLGVK